MDKFEFEDFNLESNELDDFVFRDPSLYQMMTEFTLGGFPIESIREADPGREYLLNTSGFRGPEFGKVDLLAAGCSQTFGMGVDEQETWPHLMAKNLNMSYANLGLPGTSNQKIVESIIYYIKKYGSPKVICVNFPSLYRFRIPLRSDILIYPYPRQRYVNKIQAHLFDVNMIPPNSLLKQVKDWPTYSKRPYDISTTIPYEAALYFSMMSINHLIEYCSIANIDLFFTTWYVDTDLFFSEKEKRHKEYLVGLNNSNELNMSGFLQLENLKTFSGSSHKLLCHNDHKNVTNPNWNHGTDLSRHMGAHQHLHYSEMFTFAIKNNLQKK